MNSLVQKNLLIENSINLLKTTVFRITQKRRKNSGNQNKYLKSRSVFTYKLLYLNHEQIIHEVHLQ